MKILESEVQRDGLIIYPNPAADFITIQLSNKGLQPFAEDDSPNNKELKPFVTNDKVQIFDLLGLEVAQTPSSVNKMNNTQTWASELLRIDVSHLSSGVYFIRIGDKVEKFVKE